MATGMSEETIIETINAFIPIIIMLAMVGAMLKALTSFNFGSGSDPDYSDHVKDDTPTYEHIDEEDIEEDEIEEKEEKPVRTFRFKQKGKEKREETYSGWGE